MEPDQRRPVEQRRVPRKARQLTDLEKMAFVEGYERGEQIADLALRLGAHRTTLDNLVRRLGLTREDPNSVPPAIRDDIVASYRSGETLAVIGRRHGFSPNKVQRLLVTVGQPIRARGPRQTPVTSEQLQEMVGRYEEGEAIAAVAEVAGVSYARARGCLIDAGVQMRSRGGAR